MQQVQEPCKVCVDSRGLQEEEAVQLLAVQLAEGRGAAHVEQEHQVEGGRVQVGVEHAAMGGEEA